MKKSKYVIDNMFDIYNMSIKDLKTYIRSASKSMSKKHKALENSPWSTLSSTLQYIENAKPHIGDSLWSTKGDRQLLEDRVITISALAEMTETAKSLENDIREQMLDNPFFMPSGLTSEEQEKWYEFYANSGYLTMFKENWEVYHQEMVDTIGSKRINEIALQWGDDSEKFYHDVWMEMFEEVDQWADFDKVKMSKRFHDEYNKLIARRKARKNKAKRRY